MVIQRRSMFQTFLTDQKEGTSSNSTEVFQLAQLMAWWNCGWSTLVHITLYPPYHNYSLVRISCSSLALSLILVTPWIERLSKPMLEEKLVPEVIRGSWQYFIMNGIGHFLGRQRRGSSRWPNYIGKERYTVTMLTIYFLAVFSEMAEIVKTAILSSAGWGGPAWLPVTMAEGTSTADGLFIVTVLAIILSACSFSSENVVSQGTACAWTFFPKHQRYGKDYSTESFRDDFLENKELSGWLKAQRLESSKRPAVAVWGVGFSVLGSKTGRQSALPLRN